MFEILMVELLIIVVGYLIGSIPTGYWIGKYVYKIDITKQGSKNIGATNVYRILGKKAGLATLSIDFLKGVLPLLFFDKFLLNNGYILKPEVLRVMLAASLILGHIFSVFMLFRGGKGVATAGGVFIYLLPICTLLTFLVWMLVVVVSRRVSMGSILAAFSLPFWVLFIKGWSHNMLPILILCSSISILIIVRHKQNILRLIKGQEQKINFRCKGN